MKKIFILPVAVAVVGLTGLSAFAATTNTSSSPVKHSMF
jgi:hypothetical protein